MLSQFLSKLPTRQGLLNRLPFRQMDTNGIFPISNDGPQLVNGIQVQTGSNGIEHGSEQQPGSGHFRRSEIPAMQPHARAVQLRPDRNNPSNAGPHDHTIVQMQRNGGGGGGGNEPIFVIRRGRPRSEVDNSLEDIGQNIQPRNPPIPSATVQAAVTEEVELHGVPTFLKAHFDMMYYLGISPINGKGEWGSKFQLVGFGIVTFVGMLHTFARSKLYIVDEAREGVLQDYITAWFYISSMVLQLGFLWMIAFRNKRISGILYEAGTHMPGIRYKANTWNISQYSIMFAALAIIVALTGATKLYAVVDGRIKSTEQLILTQSHAASLLLFYWKKETNGTDNFEMLDSQYGTELTPTTMIMGIFGLITTFIGVLQENAIKDILLISALHIFRLSQIFQSNMVKATVEDQASDQLVSLLRNMHLQLSKMANTTEKCFGNFFKLIHANYLLFCAYILAYILNGNVNGVYVFESMVLVLKIACILYYPTNAIGMTQDVKDVIREKFCADDCPNDVNLKKVILLLQTIEERPISIGRGNFLVDETFSLKFIGAVVTFFLFLLDADKAKQGRR